MNGSNFTRKNCWNVSAYSHIPIWRSSAKVEETPSRPDIRGHMTSSLVWIEEDSIFSYNQREKCQNHSWRQTTEPFRSCILLEVAWRELWLVDSASFNVNTCTLPRVLCRFLTVNRDRNPATDAGLHYFDIEMVFCWFCLHSCYTCTLCTLLLLCCVCRSFERVWRSGVPCPPTVCVCCVFMLDPINPDWLPGLRQWHTGKAEAR